MPDDANPNLKDDADGWPRFRKQIEVGRVRVSNWLSLIALGCLVATPVAVAYLFWYAYQLKLYPYPGAPSSPYRGPWSWTDELGRGVILLTNPLFFTFVFGVLSVAVKPNWRAWIILMLNVVACFFCVCLIALVED